MFTRKRFPLTPSTLAIDSACNHPRVFPPVESVMCGVRED